LPPIHAGVTARLGRLLRVNCDALPRRVHHPLSHGVDPWLPTRRADDGDLSPYCFQVRERGAEPGETLPRTTTHGVVRRNGARVGNFAVHPASAARKLLYTHASAEYEHARLTRRSSGAAYGQRRL